MGLMGKTPSKIDDILAAFGVGGDKNIAHLNDKEVAVLTQRLKKMGKKPSINPKTGMLSFSEGGTAGDHGDASGAGAGDGVGGDNDGTGGTSAGAGHADMGGFDRGGPAKSAGADYGDPSYSYAHNHPSAMQDATVGIAGSMFDHRGWGGKALDAIGKGIFGYEPNIDLEAGRKTHGQAIADALGIAAGFGVLGGPLGALAGTIGGPVAGTLVSGLMGPTPRSVLGSLKGMLDAGEEAYAMGLSPMSDDQNPAVGQGLPGRNVADNLTSKDIVMSTKAVGSQPYGRYSMGYPMMRGLMG
jgi:hypothetical protein